MTAEETVQIIDNNFFKQNNYYLSNTTPIYFAELTAIEFAKFHVKQALLQASENAIYTFELENVIDKESILTAYPEHLIK